MSAPDEREDEAQGPSLSAVGYQKLASFVTAAWNKYNGDMAIGDPVGIYMPRRKPARLNEYGQLVLPYCVHLPGCGIDRALSLEEGETEEDLRSMGRGVTELDLSDNRLSTLREVIKIIQFMPQLMFLDLTRNPLRASSVNLAATSIASEYVSDPYIPSFVIHKPSDAKIKESPKECVCSPEDRAMKDCDCCDVVNANGDNTNEPLIYELPTLSIICQRKCQQNESVNETRSTVAAPEVDSRDHPKTVPTMPNAEAEQSNTEYDYGKSTTHDAHSPQIPVAESFSSKCHEVPAESIMISEQVSPKAVAEDSPELSKTRAGSPMDTVETGSTQLASQEEDVQVTTVKDVLPEELLQQRVISMTTVEKSSPDVSLKEKNIPTSDVKEAAPDTSFVENNMPSKFYIEYLPEVSLIDEDTQTMFAIKTPPEESLKEDREHVANCKEAEPEVFLEEEKMAKISGEEAALEVTLQEKNMHISKTLQESLMNEEKMPTNVKESSPEISFKEEITLTEDLKASSPEDSIYFVPIKAVVKDSPGLSLKEKNMPTKTVKEDSPEVSVREEIMPSKTVKEASPEESLKQEDTPSAALKQCPDDTFPAVEKPLASSAEESLKKKLSDSHTKKSSKISHRRQTPVSSFAHADSVTIEALDGPRGEDLNEDDLHGGTSGREQVSNVLDAKLSEPTSKNIAHEIGSNVIVRSARKSLCQGSPRVGCQCVTGDRRPCCSSQLETVDKSESILNKVVESVLSAAVADDSTCELGPCSSCPSTRHYRTTTLPAHLDPSESAKKQTVKKDTDAAARKTSFTNAAPSPQKVRPGSAAVRRYSYTGSELSCSSSQAKSDSARNVEASPPSLAMTWQPRAEVETKSLGKSDVEKPASPPSIKPQVDTDTGVARGKKGAESLESTEVVRPHSPTQMRPQSVPENAENANLADSTGPLEMQPEVETQNSDKVELLPFTTLTKVLPEAIPDDEGNTGAALSSSPAKVQPMTENPQSDSGEYVSFIVPHISHSSSLESEESQDAELNHSPSQRETMSRSMSPPVILSLERSHSATQTDPEVSSSSGEESDLPSKAPSEENLSRNCSPSPGSSRNREAAQGAKPAMPQPSLAAVKLPNLHHLVLNGTGLGWTGVTGLLGMFRELEELHLSLNGYRTVDLPEDLRYPSLRRLFFCRNPVRDWREWSKLGRAFPGLRLLFMAETDVDRLGEDSSIPETFPVLQTLSLTRTALGCWAEIDKLRLFPALNDVRLQGIPFLEKFESDERREQLLARLPNISQLNGSTVTDAERQDAEKDFIRLFIMDDEKPTRYYELVKIYGEVDRTPSGSLMDPQSVVSVTIRMGKQTNVLLASTSQTLLDFKRSMESWTGMTPSRFVLLYKKAQAPEGTQPVKLKDLDTTLKQLDVQDGDEFIVELKTHLE